MYFLTHKKGTPGLMQKGCVLQRVSLGALSYVTVVLGMRQVYAVPIHFAYLLHLPICPFAHLPICPFAPVLFK